MRTNCAKATFLLAVAIGIAAIGRAQELVDKTGTMLINFHAGPSFANFISAEAPHKYLSDFWYEGYLISAAIPLVDYQTQFIQDHRIGVSAGVSLEKYIKNNVSLLIGLNYEAKGIDLKYRVNPLFIDIDDPAYEKGYLKTKVNNKYLTAPIIVRRYFFPKQIFYAQAGVYLAYLTSSKISVDAARTAPIQYQLTGPNGVAIASGGSNVTPFSITDKSKDNTHLLDYGVSAGCGLKLPLSNRIYFTTDLLINIALRKIDRKNNNEYEKANLPASSGFNEVILSGNYFGLSSKAKNLNTALTVGISIEL